MHVFQSAESMVHINSGGEIQLSIEQGLLSEIHLEMFGMEYIIGNMCDIDVSLSFEVKY